MLAADVSVELIGMRDALGEVWRLAMTIYAIGCGSGLAVGFVLGAGFGALICRRAKLTTTSCTKVSQPPVLLPTTLLPQPPGGPSGHS